MAYETDIRNYTIEDIDALWDKGFRGYEIYTYNKYDIIGTCEADDELTKAGTFSGWDIEFVFSTPELLKDMPFFDVIIMGASLSDCQTVWRG